MEDWVNLDPAKSFKVTFKNETSSNVLLALDVQTLHQREHLTLPEGIAERSIYCLGAFSNNPISQQIENGSTDVWINDGNVSTFSDENCSNNEVCILNVGMIKATISPEVITLASQEEKTLNIDSSEKVLWLGRVKNSDISAQIEDFRCKNGLYDSEKPLKVTLSSNPVKPIFVSND